MGTWIYNVEPRYTSGSPAAVSEEIAMRVAAQEKDAFQHCLEGISGLNDKHTAETLGLSLIVFEMVEKSKGWVVHDLITDEWYWWPYKGTCQVCHARNVDCKRGVLHPHQWPGSGRIGECRVTSPQNYVGKKLRDENANYSYNGR